MCFISIRLLLFIVSLVCVLRHCLTKAALNQSSHVSGCLSGGAGQGALLLEEQFRRAHVHQLGSSNPVPLPRWLREEFKELTEMERQEPALVIAPSEHPKGQPHACSPQQQRHFKVGLGKRKKSTPLSPRISFRAPAPIQKWTWLSRL